MVRGSRRRRRRVCEKFFGINLVFKNVIYGNNHNLRNVKLILMNAKLIAFVLRKILFLLIKCRSAGKPDFSRTEHISGRVSRETLLGESYSSFFSLALCLACPTHQNGLLTKSCSCFSLLLQ